MDQAEKDRRFNQAAWDLLAAFGVWAFWTAAAFGLAVFIAYADHTISAV